jgi:hypothetical protein
MRPTPPYLICRRYRHRVDLRSRPDAPRCSHRIFIRDDDGILRYEDCRLCVDNRCRRSLLLGRRGVLLFRSATCEKNRFMKVAC